MFLWMTWRTLATPVQKLRVITRRSMKVRSPIVFLQRITYMNTVGDTMIRELDFSKITLRIIEHVDKDGGGDEDHVIAKLTGNTIDTLRRCLVRQPKLFSWTVELII